jgi:hypothetical protein
VVVLLFVWQPQMLLSSAGPWITAYVNSHELWTRTYAKHLLNVLCRVTPRFILTSSSSHNNNNNNEFIMFKLNSFVRRCGARSLGASSRRSHD